jgi:hypothetical protein
MMPREMMARVDGRAYEPGGAAELDELMDLFAVWEAQRAQPKGSGIDPSMADDD